MENLFNEFHAADAATWKARLEKDLKGITFSELSVIDRNGITIHPFYTSEDMAPAYQPLSKNAGWEICARIPVNDARTANRMALNELNNGATGIFFDINDNTDIPVLLKDIELPYIYSCFRIPSGQQEILKQLKDYLAGKGYTFSAINTFLYYDYIASYLQTDNQEILTAGRKWSLALFKETGVIGIDGGIFLNAGAATTYELACSLALVNEYLHALYEDKLLDGLRKLHITLSTDTAFFEQISKLRAFRKLLDLLCDQYNCSPGIHLHVRTGQTYQSPFDSYSNLLRSTVAGMAAVIGGCNSLYIHPFNEAVTPGDDFGRRMSRNQQLIFREESYLDKVGDAAAGSYYIETLTDQLADKAWELFKEIESGGGLLKAFEKGIVTGNIRQQADRLISEYKEGKKVLVGVNKFPAPGDAPVYTATEPVTDDKAIRPLSIAEAILQP